jgi:AMMECR1 domain-containing protein
MTTDKKRIEFLEHMKKKAEIEKEFWDDQIKNYDYQILKIKDSGDKVNKSPLS